MSLNNITEQFYAAVAQEEKIADSKYREAAEELKARWNQFTSAITDDGKCLEQLLGKDAEFVGDGEANAWFTWKQIFELMRHGPSDHFGTSSQAPYTDSRLAVFVESKDYIMFLLEKHFGDDFSYKKNWSGFPTSEWERGRTGTLQAIIERCDADTLREALISEDLSQYHGGDEILQPERTALPIAPKLPDSDFEALSEHQGGDEIPQPERTSLQKASKFSWDFLTTPQGKAALATVVLVACGGIAGGVVGLLMQTGDIATSTGAAKAIETAFNELGGLIGGGVVTGMLAGLAVALSLATLAVLAYGALKGIEKLDESCLEPERSLYSSEPGAAKSGQEQSVVCTLT